MHMKKDNINFPHTVMGYEQVITTQNLDLEIWMLKRAELSLNN